jgi:hypothetical protein
VRTTLAGSQVRPPGAEPGTELAQPGRHPGWRGRVSDLRSSPFLVSTIACVALAALSAAILPTVPSYDPWSWIVWGREVFDPHLSFTVSGGPSWKPLPVVFTAVFGLFGGAAPTLWVITARAGGLMALVAAYRLAARVVRSWSPDVPAAAWAPIVAGLFAAIGVALTQEFSYYMFRGTSEPTLVGATLWAIDRHLDRRCWQAFALGVVASLIRPEAWPFILLYAIWLWRRDRTMRSGVFLLIGLALIPFLWFVPPWIGTGQPFIAASHAKDYNGHLGAHPFIEVNRRGFDLQPAPWLILGLAATAMAWFRRPRNALVLGLAAAAAAWWALVVAMTVDGYPGLERFFLPAAGVICVLAGAGLVELPRLIAGFVGKRAPGVRYATIALTVVMVALSVPFTTSRIDRARAQRPIAERAVTRLDQLSAAVAAVGGRAGVYPCRSSFAAVNHSAQTALAWKLHVTLERVGTSMRHAGVMFVGPHDSIDGGAPRIDPRLNRFQLVAHVGAWKVYRVWQAPHLNACIGGAGR